MALPSLRCLETLGTYAVIVLHLIALVASLTGAQVPLTVSANRHGLGDSEHPSRHVFTSEQIKPNLVNDRPIFDQPKENKRTESCRSQTESNFQKNLTVLLWSRVEDWLDLSDAANTDSDSESESSSTTSESNATIGGYNFPAKCLLEAPPRSQQGPQVGVNSKADRDDTIFTQTRSLPCVECALGCGSSRWTYDRSMLPTADVVIFNLPEWQNQDDPIGGGVVFPSELVGRTFDASSSNDRSLANSQSRCPSHSSTDRVSSKFHSEINGKCVTSKNRRNQLGNRQIWVLLITEPPCATKRCSFAAHLTAPVFMSAFDLIASWLPNSDIYLPPWQRHFAVQRDLLADPGPLDERDAPALAVFMHNNCDAPSGRTEFVVELMRHIAVDSFGECLKTKDLPIVSSYGSSDDKTGSVGQQQHGSKMSIMRRYKFAITMENTIVPGWVTEKLFDALASGAVPIYLGAPDITDFLPRSESGKHSIIDVGSDNRYGPGGIVVDSPATLADLLLQLDEDDDAYNEFQHWRQLHENRDWAIRYQTHTKDKAPCEIIAKSTEIIRHGQSPSHHACDDDAPNGVFSPSHRDGVRVYTDLGWKYVSPLARLSDHHGPDHHGPRSNSDSKSQRSQAQAASKNMMNGHADGRHGELPSPHSRHSESRNVSFFIIHDASLHTRKKILKEHLDSAGFSDYDMKWVTEPLTNDEYLDWATINNSNVSDGPNVSDGFSREPLPSWYSRNETAWNLQRRDTPPIGWATPFRTLSEGELGVAGRHFAALTTFVTSQVESAFDWKDHQDDVAVIIEDDAIPNAAAASSIRRMLDELPLDFGVISLGRGHEPSPSQRQSEALLTTRALPTHSTWTCLATAYTRESAKRLLGALLPMTLPIDWAVTAAAKRTNTLLYRAVPPLFDHGSVTGVFDSSIRNMHGVPSKKYVSSHHGTGSARARGQSGDERPGSTSLNNFIYTSVDGNTNLNPTTGNPGLPSNGHDGGRAGAPASVCHRIHPRVSSAPFLSGDGLRWYCDFVFDETPCALQRPEHVFHGAIVFVKGDLLGDWFLRLHDKISVAYAIVSHNSDVGTPGDYLRFLDDKNIIAFYGANVDVQGGSHYKVRPLPLGLENAHHARDPVLHVQWLRQQFPLHHNRIGDKRVRRKAMQKLATTSARGMSDDTEVPLFVSFSIDSEGVGLAGVTVPLTQSPTPSYTNSDSHSDIDTTRTVPMVADVGDMIDIIGTNSSQWHDVSGDSERNSAVAAINRIIASRRQGQSDAAQIDVDMSGTLVRMSRKDYILRLFRGGFVPSPWGGGFDCHRTWEALLAGAWPVVRLRVAPAPTVTRTSGTSTSGTPSDTSSESDLESNQRLGRHRDADGGPGARARIRDDSDASGDTSTSDTNFVPTSSFRTPLRGLGLSHRLYDDLPLWIVSEWTELTATAIIEQTIEFQRRLTSHPQAYRAGLSRLYLQYWIDEIYSSVNRAAPIVWGPPSMQSSQTKR